MSADTIAFSLFACQPVNPWYLLLGSGCNTGRTSRDSVQYFSILPTYAGPNVWKRSVVCIQKQNELCGLGKKRFFLSHQSSSLELKKKKSSAYFIYLFIFEGTQEFPSGSYLSQLPFLFCITATFTPVPLAQTPLPLILPSWKQQPQFQQLLPWHTLHCAAKSLSECSDTK